MTKRAALLLALTVVTFAGGSIAMASTAQRAVPSSVKFVSLQEVLGYVYVAGTISSSKAACEKNRKVTVKFLLVDDSTFKFDVARSGAEGGWLAARPVDEVDDLPDLAAVEAKAEKRTVRVSSSKKIVCGADRALTLINS